MFLQFQGAGRGVCNFVGEVGDTDTQTNPIRPPQLINIGGNFGHVTDSGISTDLSTITASVAVQLEGFSLVVVIYSLFEILGNNKREY